MTDKLTAPSASLVIPCRNEAAHIEKCLRDVLAFESPAGGFEVIVADGMSADGTREIIERIAAGDPRITLIDNPRRNASAAMNEGIQVARADIVVRLDAHTEYAPDYLVRCLEVMRQTGADNVGGPALTRSTSYMHRAIAAAYHSRFAVGNAVFHQPDYEGPADTVPYGCFRKSLLVELGLFDEALIRNQDDELNLRIIRAGGKIWQSPSIRSWYSPRSSLKALFQQYFQYGYWKVLVIRKHRIPASLRHLVPGLFVASLIVTGIGAPFCVQSRVLLAGIAGLYALGMLMASAITAASAGWSLLPVLPLTFACYHVGYGSGFLIGIWDFVVRRKGSGRFTQLTRK